MHFCNSILRTHLHLLGLRHEMHYIVGAFAYFLLKACLAADCRMISESEKIAVVTESTLEKCIVFIGRNPIDKHTAEKIWETIKKVYNGVDGIPLQTFKNMGWILSGIQQDDLRNMSIDEGELIKIFGSTEALIDDQMNIIAQNVKSNWANKTPEKYSEYDLAILGKILCYFKPTEILKIHSDAYRGAAEAIGKLNTCPREIIEAFAKIAVQNDAYGPPWRWSKMDISQIGIVIAGLSEKEYNSLHMDNLTQNKHVYNQVFNYRYPNKSSVNVN